MLPELELGRGSAPLGRLASGSSIAQDRTPSVRRAGSTARTGSRCIGTVDGKRNDLTSEPPATFSMRELLIVLRA
jgi:hypothetical protein